MENSKPFLLYLRKFIELTDEEFQKSILPICKIRRFDKKQLLIKGGEVENYINFILSGLVRKYYYRGKEEINTQISYEGHIIHSVESFHSRQPSEYYVEAIEPCRVLSIAYQDLEELMKNSHKMEHLGRVVTTHTLVLRDRYQMQLVKLTPRERFLDFVTRNPELLQRVPQKYLASYLNIKPETFSRFKHLIRNHHVKLNAMS